MKGEDVDYTKSHGIYTFSSLKEFAEFFGYSVRTAGVQNYSQEGASACFSNPEQLKIYVIRDKLQSTPILLLGYGLGGIC